MNNSLKRRNQGFALIVTMLVLLILTILVINSVRSSIMNEQMAGSYLDRNRALFAAEQALRQGEALLLTNGEKCLAGCDVAAGSVDLSSTQVNSIPTGWDAGKASRTATLATTGQGTSATFQIVQLNDSLRANGKGACKAYSIIARGVGLDSRAGAHLQTVVHVCPLDI